MQSLSTVLATITLLVLTVPALASPEIGKPAPDFTVMDTNGNEVSLAALKGKTVVLEWTNDGCPYVRKHYDSNNMQTLQKEAAADDVVWVSVISSAPGKQGYVTAEEGNALTTKHNAMPAHLVLDPQGEIGRDYAAKTTPHMFIIDDKGDLVFKGGIDDKPTADKADIEGATNFVRTTLSDLKNGQPVAAPTSRPYGCSIKYAS